MRRKIPVHLQTPDTLLLGMTARQLLIVSLGVTLCYIAITGSWGIPLLLVPAVVLSAIILIVTLLMAFVAPKKRYLDAWTMVVLTFLLSPKCYVWRPLPQEIIRESNHRQASKLDLDSEDEQEEANV